MNGMGGLHLLMCVNADANVSSSMSHTVRRVMDGVLSNPVQVATHLPGHKGMFTAVVKKRVEEGSGKWVME